MAYPRPQIITTATMEDKALRSSPPELKEPPNLLKFFDLCFSFCRLEPGKAYKFLLKSLLTFFLSVV